MTDIGHQYTELVVDGEMLYLPNLLYWEKIMFEHSFLGSPISCEKLLREMFDKCKLYRDVFLVLGKIGKAINEWISYYLVYVNSRPTRISLLMDKCNYCNWHGVVGTTMDTELYMSLGSEFHSRLKIAFDLPPCLCSSCGKRMKEGIVWCENSQY